jgi:hypothetical protein
VPIFPLVDRGKNFGQDICIIAIFVLGSYFKVGAMIISPFYMFVELFGSN